MGRFHCCIDGAAVLKRVLQFYGYPSEAISVEVNVYNTAIREYKRIHELGWNCVFEYHCIEDYSVRRSPNWMNPDAFHQKVVHDTAPKITRRMNQRNGGENE